MHQHISAKTFRRLTRAEGYLELDMPDYALEELAAIDDPGPVEAVVAFMTGQALKQQERYEAAITPLKRAVALIPAPHNRLAWASLGECFRLGGNDELADVIDKFVESTATRRVVVPLAIELQITVQPPIDVALPPTDAEDDTHLNQ